MKRNDWITNLSLMLVISLLTTSIALASPLTQPKADGLIGEQANGYIGLVRQDVPAEIRKLVDEVNAKRKAGYQKIATKQGVSLESVGQLRPGCKRGLAEKVVYARPVTTGLDFLFHTC